MSWGPMYWYTNGILYHLESLRCNQIHQYVPGQSSNPPPMTQHLEDVRGNQSACGSEVSRRATGSCCEASQSSQLGCIPKCPKAQYGGDGEPIWMPASHQYLQLTRKVEITTCTFLVIFFPISTSIFVFIHLYHLSTDKHQIKTQHRVTLVFRFCMNPSWILCYSFKCKNN